MGENCQERRKSMDKPPEVKGLESDEDNISESFETPTDPALLVPWDTIQIKAKELYENTIRETKENYEILNAQKTHHEQSFCKKSKELAIKLRDERTDEETVKKEFDVFWDQCVKNIIRDTPPIRDINIMRDVKLLLSDMYESVPVDHWMESRDIFTVIHYSEYVITKSGIREAVRDRTVEYTQTLSPEDESQIRLLVSDVALQTDRMIQSFNISKMGYNTSYIQLLTDNIQTRVTQHEEGPVRYVFKNEFFMDLVLSICERANKMITDQHTLFREDNDPVIYVQKKREEYYSIFLKYCQGATSAVIFGEIICQKLKEPIEQSVYKRTARDIADEMRSNCESMRGNRSHLEKHILKRLAEEEDFNKYMNYISYPTEHFRRFIRDEVSRYITDQFSLSVLPKMKRITELLQQKIMRAAHQSTERVHENRGDAGLWMKSFTQQLSDDLIFSEEDLSGVKHDDVDDFNLLEDVIRQKLTAIVSDISRRFNTETFPVKLDYKDRPDELLIDHFCQCCWVQCPFCGAICTNTIEDHPGDHSVALHRISGFIGWFYKDTDNLSLSFCTTETAGNRSFYIGDKSFPWREYRKAGGVYAKWSINPDVSEQIYWKWFVCRFQRDLEKYYNKTFEKSGRIPDEWRIYSKQDAIKSLDKYM